MVPLFCLSSLTEEITSTFIDRLRATSHTHTIAISPSAILANGALRLLWRPWCAVMDGFFLTLPLTCSTVPNSCTRFVNEEGSTRMAHMIRSR